MEAYKTERVTYTKEDTRLYFQFKTDTLDELGLTNHPKANRFFDICWDEGHSSGYESVWSYMQDWADLLV